MKYADDFCQIQDDGSIDCGDCVNWLGNYIYLTGKKLGYIGFFEVSPGAYVRHPHRHKTNYGFGSYYNGIWDGCITRDQLTGIIAALIALENEKAIARLIYNHRQRGYLFSYSRVKRGEDIRDNVRRFPDVTGPETWQMLIRASKKTGFMARLGLYICDIWMLLATIFDKYSDNEDNITFLVQAMVSYEHGSTYISRFSKRIVSLAQQKDKLERYWCQWRNKPWMVELYIKKLKSLGVK